MTVPPSLRQERADQTRARILDAFSELLVETDVAEISVPDVARRSGVSLRTIYRYYPSRDDLLDAAGDWIFRRSFGDDVGEEALDELPASFAAKGKQWDSHPELARALAYSPTSKALVARRRAQRLVQISAALEQAAPRLTARERDQAAAVLGYLQSIRAWVTLRQDVGLSHDDSVAAIGGALKTLIDDIRRRNRAAGISKGRTR